MQQFLQAALSVEQSTAHWTGFSWPLTFMTAKRKVGRPSCRTLWLLAALSSVQNLWLTKPNGALQLWIEMLLLLLAVLLKTHVTWGNEAHPMWGCVKAHAIAMQFSGEKMHEATFAAHRNWSAQENHKGVLTCSHWIITLMLYRGHSNPNSHTHWSPKEC